MNLGHLVAELEDRLNPREVNSEVALKAEDGPDPANFGRTIPLDITLTNRMDQSPVLVSNEDRRSDRKLLGHHVTGDYANCRYHGWSKAPIR